MAGSGMFWTFLTIALLVPVVLLVVVRFMARVLPPPFSTFARFTREHPVLWAWVDVALWALLLVNSFAAQWAEQAGALEWTWRWLAALMLIMVLVDAVRATRGQDDLLKTYINKRYPNI